MVFSGNALAIEMAVSYAANKCTCMKFDRVRVNAVSI
jgi:hypothetical protein